MKNNVDQDNKKPADLDLTCYKYCSFSTFDTFDFSPDLTVSLVLAVFCFEISLSLSTCFKTSLSLSTLDAFPDAALLPFLTSFVSSVFTSSLNSSVI